jgi:hypothetical protein
VGLVYDHDPEEVARLGWAEFISRQWESIFVGYRSWTGLRTMGRRWGDLIETGLGCSQDVADWLVRENIIHGPDRGLESAGEPGAVVAGMVGVLADLRYCLAEMAELAEPAELGMAVPGLLDEHARLISFIRTHVFGHDSAETA